MSDLARTTQLSETLPPVCRLGLASRGNTHLPAASVRWAIERGINYLNWCGRADGLSRAIGELSEADRRRVVVAVQFKARAADEAKRELEAVLDELRSSYLDVLTFYYVETIGDWQRITARGGAMETMVRARAAGRVRLLGMTTHQRPLAAKVAETGLLDLLMIRYNAAHRGAERDIFPTTQALGLPVVAFTCLRWGALLRSTPDDPPGFTPPPAPEWYRFVLAQPNVSVALMAPNDHHELTRNLSLLDDWRAPLPQQRAMLTAHGDRVHRHGGGFP